MKRKYLAMALGMVMAISPMGVMAEETETEAAVEMNENTARESQLWGEVKSAEEDSITIAVGTFEAVSDDADGTADSMDETADEAEEINEEMDETAEEVNEAADEAAEAAIGGSVFGEQELVFTGEEQTVAITADTEIYLVYGNGDVESVEAAAAEFSGTSEADVEGTDTEVNEEESTDAEAIVEEDAEEPTDAQTNAEENADEDMDADADEPADVQADSEDAAALEEEAELYIEDAVAESILQEDLVYIVLDEEGNASVIMIVLPDADSSVSAEDEAVDEVLISVEDEVTDEANLAVEEDAADAELSEEQEADE